MPPGRHGPAEVFLLVDGYDITLNAIQSMEYEEEAETAETTGLGSAFRAHTPTGLARVGVSFEGAVLDDASLRSKDALETLPTGPQSTDRIISLGAAGTSIGSNCEGFEGAIQNKYTVLADFEDLQRVNATFEMSGARDASVVLHPLTQETSDGNTQSSSVDHGSSTTGDGVGYLHVNKTTAGDGVTAKIRHSSDDITYVDLLAFTSASSTGPTAERKTVTGGIARYTALSWAFGTTIQTGDATLFGSVSRGTTF